MPQTTLDRLLEERLGETGLFEMRPIHPRLSLARKQTKRDPAIEQREIHSAPGFNAFLPRGAQRILDIGRRDFEMHLRRDAERFRDECLSMDRGPQALQ